MEPGLPIPNPSADQLTLGKAVWAEQECRTSPCLGPQGPGVQLGHES